MSVNVCSRVGSVLRKGFFWFYFVLGCVCVCVLKKTNISRVYLLIFSFDIRRYIF
jgi:hypothetical protein